MLTRERLDELLRFDEATGRLFWKVSRGGWGAGREAGSIMFDGYRRIGIDGKQYRAHELVWFLSRGEWPEFHIDHKDRDRDNNRPDNLRRATYSQNSANTALNARNTSGFKGVSRIRGTNRWLATIKVLGRSKCLGRYDSPEDAHTAYAKAAVEAFGEYARTA